MTEESGLPQTSPRQAQLNRGAARGTGQTGAAPISTRRLYLDLTFKPTAEELEKGVATLTFLPKHIKTTSKKGAPRFHITDKTLDRVYAAMSATENELPTLYAHGKSPAHGPIAAAWFQELSREKDRIAVKVKFTERALREIRAGEWGYVSPGLDVEELPDGSVEPYDGFELSLTNTPLIDGQQRIAADRDGGTNMDVKKFAKLAGVAEDATEDAILAGLEKKLAPPEPAKGSGELTDAQVTVLADRLGIKKLGEQIAEVAKGHATAILEAERKTNRVNALLERAEREGKVVPAERKVMVDGKEHDPIRIFCESNPAAFEGWLKNAPRKAPVAGAFPATSQLTDALTDDEKAPGAFAKADLANPDVRVRLDRAAKALVEAKKSPDYAAATLELTRAN